MREILSRGRTPPRAASGRARRRARSQRGSNGRAAGREQLDEWLRVAETVEGLVGFAIGRSTWWEALEGRLDGSLDEDAVRARVAANSTHFVETSVAARG